MTVSTLPDAASARLQARIAGVLYLSTMICGFAALSIRSTLIIRGDAAATAAGILVSEPLYRLGFILEIAGGAGYVGVTAILCVLLARVSRTTSLTAAFFSLTGCAIGAASAANLMTPFLLLNGGPHYLSAFTPDQLQALTMSALRLQGQGYTIAMIFFGVYCALVGGLIYRSGFMPKIVGILMMFAGAGWLVDTLTSFLDPALSRALDPWSMIPGSIGEASLMLWLLIGGVNRPRWEAGAVAMATQVGAGKDGGLTPAYHRAN
jgi:hypothetical protein